MKAKCCLVAAGMMLLMAVSSLAPGVKAKYTYISDLHSVNLETKTTVTVTFRAPDWGEGFVNEDSDMQDGVVILKKDLILGDNYGSSNNTFPVPYSSARVFDKWIGVSKLTGQEKNITEDMQFTGEYITLTAEFRSAIVTFHDNVYAEIPQSSKWIGFGESAAMDAPRLYFGLSEDQIPVLEHDGAEFLGWYMIDADGVEQMLETGKRLPVRDYDLYAKWGDPTASGHNSLLSIVR